jgi:hypothetical protein
LAKVNGMYELTHSSTRPLNIEKLHIKGHGALVRYLKRCIAPTLRTHDKRRTGTSAVAVLLCIGQYIVMVLNYGTANVLLDIPMPWKIVFFFTGPSIFIVQVRS